MRITFQGDLIRRIGPFRPDAVISFPKAGRNWLRMMLAELGAYPKFDHAGAHAHKRQPGQRFDTRLARKYRRIVFLHRDPRDTAISGYYTMSVRRSGNVAGRPRYTGTLSEYIRDPRHGISQIAQFNVMWLNLVAERVNMIAISYEQMQAETAQSLDKVARFLGFAPSLETVASAVAACSIERVRERERVGEILSAPRDPENPNAYKYRRGKAGGYRDELSGDDLAFCRAALAEADQHRLLSLA